METTSVEILFSVLIVLIILSAFFSSAETSMMTLNYYRLKHLAKHNHRGAIRAAKLLKRPDQLISLVLIGNNIVSIAASAIATLITLQLYGKAGVAIATVLLTIVILIFSEVTPKTIAAYYPEKIAFPASFVLGPLMWLLYPLVWVINHISALLARPFGINLRKTREDSLSRDELRIVVGSAGRIPARHKGMLLNILDLEQVTVDDIMVPRNEVFGVDLTASDNRVVEQLLSSEYTRLPAFEKDINNIVGILHLRSAAHLFQNGQFDRKLLMTVLSEPYFIPENTPLHIQLHKFQEEKRRMAIVVDEYGQVQGLVTLEDILEEIVGEFTSNIADNIEEIIPQKDGSFVIDGTADLRDVNRALDWDLSTEGARTINGLLLEYLEMFPTGNCCVRVNGYRFEILDIADNRIQAVRVLPPNKP